mgnify:CR=1 FL=1
MQTSLFTENQPSVLIADNNFVNPISDSDIAFSEVYIVDSQSVSFEVCYDVIHSLTLQRKHFVNSCDLGTDVEVQADEVDVFALLEDVYELVELVLRDAELVLI